MRVTQGMTADNALYNLQQGRAKLDRVQEQIASGSVINRPSDDPISVRQILDLEDKVKEGDQYSSNIAKGSLWLNVTSTALQSISDIVGLAKKLAGTITSGSSNVTERGNVTSQMTELKKQLVDLGNTRVGDQYIFGGFNNSISPFTQGSNTYNGTSDKIEVEIDKGSRVSINIPGGDLLKGTGAYGSVDVLQTIDDLITAINANDVPTIQAQAGNLDSAANQVTNAEADVAGRMIRLQAAQSMVDRNQSTLKTMISGLQDVDYSKAGVQLAKQQNALQAALSTTAKITSLSLLDYLR